MCTAPLHMTNPNRPNHPQQQLLAPPLIPLAAPHQLLAGMGAQKDMGLSFYAEAFASGGLAAFVFDYRSFGGSDGEPRQWVSPSRHVQVSTWYAPALSVIHCLTGSTCNVCQLHVQPQHAAGSRRVTLRPVRGVLRQRVPLHSCCQCYTAAG